MVEDASNQKKSIANGCRNVHRELYPLNPRFLRRNIRQILDSHAKVLRQVSGASAAPHEDMVADARCDWGWDFPDSKMLDAFVTEDKPILQIESLQLRGPDSKARALRHSRQSTRSVGIDDLEWLPDPQSDAFWPCTVSIAVSRPQNSRQKTFYKSVSAKVLQTPSNGQHANFEVKFDRPFFMEVLDIFAPLDSSRHGERSWKKMVTPPYSIELAIHCQDSDDSAELLSRLESRSVSSYKNTPSSESVLKATWEQFPTCPRDDELLTIRRPQGHRSLELACKMQVGMGWINKREHRLRKYNKLFESKVDEIRQLPTPSASDDMEKAVKGFKIVFKLKDNSSSNSKIFEVRSLTCPLCREAKDYGYFDRLILHCKTHHSHFDFVPSLDVDNSDSSTFRATVVMTIARHFEKQDDEEEAGMNWMAPNRPFNIVAHNRGEDNWTGEARMKSRRGTGRHPRDNKTATATPPLALPSRKRPAPDEVEDLPQHQPKRHCVPYVPGISFYHTTSKQEIQAGEAVTESDDEIDESWLTQSQEHALIDLGLVGAAKDFASAFNQHLASEQSDSSILVRDALVRFTRRHREQLRHIEWQRLFRAKLNQLRAVGIIGDDIVSACVSLMQSGPGRRVNGEMQEATVAGAQDGQEVTIETSQHKSAVNGVSMKTLLSNGHTINGVRSASPVDGETRSREAPRANKGKAAVHGDTDINSEGPPDENTRCHAHETNDSRRPASLAHKASCLCGKSAKDARASIACADPVSQFLSSSRKRFD